MNKLRIIFNNFRVLWDIKSFLALKRLKMFLYLLDMYLLNVPKIYYYEKAFILTIQDLYFERRNEYCTYILPIVKLKKFSIEVLLTRSITAIMHKLYPQNDLDKKALKRCIQKVNQQFKPLEDKIKKNRLNNLLILTLK